MSLFTQWVPHTWADEPHTAELEAYADRVVDGYTELAPNFKQSIVHRQVIGPYEMEHEYGLLGGNIFHGELSADQLFHLRPAPGYADFTTPIDGLYQCSSATHGGGGVTGIPALLCTRRILQRPARATVSRALIASAWEDRVVSAPTAAPVEPRGPRRGARSHRAAAACCPARPTPTTRCSTWEREQFFAAHLVVRGTGLRSRRARSAARRAASPAKACSSSATSDGTLARVRQHVSPPRSRAAAVRRDREARRDPLPVPRVDLRARRRAAGDAAVRAAGRVRSRRERPRRVARRGVERLGDGQPVGRRAAAQPSTSARSTRSSPTTECDRLVTGAVHEYTMAANWKLPIENYHECYHCPAIHPGAVRREPADERRQLHAARACSSAARWTSSPSRPRCRWTARAAASVLPEARREAAARDRLHRAVPEPADQRAPRLRDDAPHRAAQPVALVRSSASGCSPPRPSRRRASTRPTRSTSGTSPTVRTGRPAKGVQRGLASRGYRPGPFAAQEDAVQQWVTLIARSYLAGALQPV